MALTGEARLARWIADLEARHLADLTLPEVARALRALSSTYVERRARLSGRGAFDSAGKRAAYSLYYAPRRWQMVTHVVRALAGARDMDTILDLGCGTGVAGAVWALEALDASNACDLTGTDTHPWALDETRATYRALGIAGRALRAAATAETVARVRRQHGHGGRGLGIVASYVVNELTDEDRRTLLPSLLVAAGAGAHVLVIEPLSRRTSPWWAAWAREITSAGGRADEWRFHADLPAVTCALGRAAGLTAGELTARTLWL